VWKFLTFRGDVMKELIFKDGVRIVDKKVFSMEIKSFLGDVLTAQECDEIKKCIEILHARSPFDMGYCARHGGVSVLFHATTKPKRHTGDDRGSQDVFYYLDKYFDYTKWDGQKFADRIRKKIEILTINGEKF
jgi:hypothetical protein